MHAAGVYQYANGVDSFFTTSSSWAAGEPDHISGYNSGETEHYVLVDTDTMLLNDAPGEFYGYAPWKTYPQPNIVGCCEAPVGPINTCPSNYTSLDKSGYCYMGVAAAEGYTWADAVSACRSNSGFLAHITDATTAASVVTNHCGGTVPASLSFWVGLQNLTGAVNSTDKQDDHWRWYGSGADNSFLRSGGMNSYWDMSPPSFAGYEHCVFARAASGGLLSVAGCGATTLDTTMSACCMVQGFHVTPTPNVTPSPPASCTSTPSVNMIESVSPSPFLSRSQVR
jgi:hypothetical protein